MKILIIGINFFPEEIGVGKYTGEMAAYLASQGHAIRVITAPPYYPHWQVQAPYRAWQYRREEWQGVEIIRCPLWVPENLNGIKRLLHLLSFNLAGLFALPGQIAWRPHVVLAIAPTFFSAPLALLLGKLSRAKTWLHVQDFELDAALNLGMLPQGNWLVKNAHKWEQSILKRFWRLSSISNEMVNLLLKKGVEKQHTFLFPNWVDTEAIYPLETSDFRARLSIPDGKIVVLYAGNMGEKQGLEMLVKAAKLLAAETNIHFVLSGEGASKHKLQQAAQGMDNVQFCDLQPAEKLNRLLNLADIHVLPQSAGAADLVMPSKLGGMLASGRPVVATAHLGTELGQVVGHVGVLTPPGDTESLAQAILQLAQDPSLREEYGRKGRDWVTNNLEKNRILREFLTNLEGLAKQ